MIIGTAGHIDHGKTSLVKALTGVDADRLPEEKARGITLDLGYAYVPLPGDEGGERLGFIDVPGHEKLVHNMLAGATGIDFLLLVVAADDGPMPQTREHLAIARLLDLRRGAVALTKCDAVDGERVTAAEREVVALLAASGLGEWPVFRVSARTGDGIAALRAHLATEAARTTAADDGGRFRLAIDRCFTLAGIGTVVTGTAFSGSVCVGDTLCVSPPGYTARVRSLHAQDQPADTGRRGQRLALNLVGDFSRDDLRRGMWLLDPVQHLPLDRFAATLTLAADAPAPLHHWTQVHLHLGAEDIVGRVALLEGDRLPPGDEMLAELVLERPLACVAGDRFVIRDAGASRTLGGGRVLDIFPPSRHKRAPARLAALRLARAGDAAGVLARQLADSPAGVALVRFARGWNLSEAAAAALTAGCAVRRVAARDGDLGFSPAHWQALGERLLAALAADHERAPDMPGVEHERLRRLTLPTLPRIAFDALVDEALAAGQLTRTSSWLHLPGHRIALSAADEALWASLAPLLAATPFQPPRVRDVARESGVAEESVRALMKRVARTGRLYPVAHDHYFTDAAVNALARIVAELHAAEGSVRAAALRDRIGGGRKVAIHLLEFFDRIGYTRRVRDSHVLRGDPEQFS